MSEADTTVFLQNLKKEIYLKNFQDCDNLRETLIVLWNFLLTLSSDAKSSIRISASRTTGYFMQVVTPFYPDEMGSTFIECIKNNSYPTIGYSYIAAAFAFLVKFVSQPFLQQFMQLSKIERFINTTDETALDYMQSIISDLKVLGVEWNKNLLMQFLKLNEYRLNRHFFKPITAAIANYPRDLYPDFIKFMSINPVKNLPLVSFVLSNVDLFDNSIVMKEIFSAAFIILEDEDGGVAARDSALQTLSVLSKYYEVNIKIVGENVSISSNGKEITLPIQELSKCNSFFTFCLPLSLITPTNNDGALITSIKSKSIARCVNQHLITAKEAFDVYQDLILNSQLDKLSSVMKGFISCANELLKQQPKEMSLLIKKLVVSKPSSWTDAMDIICLLDSLDVFLIKSEIGTPFIYDISYHIFKYLRYDQPILTKKVLGLLEKLKSNEVEQALLSHLDAFGSDLKYSFNALEAIGSTNNTIQRIAYEVANENEILITSYALSFLSNGQSFLSDNDIRYLIDLSMCIISGCYESLTHIKLESKLKLEFNDLTDSLSVDVLELNSREYIYYPFYAAAKFVFSTRADLVGAENSVKLFDSLFGLMPYEASKFVENNFELFGTDEQILLFNMGVQKLRFINSLSVHTIWCQISLKIDDIMQNQDFAISTSFLHVVASQALSIPTLTPKIGAVFCAFLTMTLASSKVIVTDYIKTLEKDKEKNDEFFTELNYVSLEAFAQISKQYPDRIPEPIIEQSDKDNFVFDEDNLNQENFKDILNEAIKTNKISAAYFVLKAAQKKDLYLKDSEIVFPSKFENIISQMLKIKIDKIDTAMELYKTPFKNQATAFLKEYDTLRYFTSKSKLTKNDFQTMCAFLSDDILNGTLVLNIVSRMLASCKSEARLRVMLHLFAVAASKALQFEESMADEVVELLNLKLEFLPLRETAICLSSMTERVDPSKQIVFFVYKLYKDGSCFSFSHAKFSLILQKFSSTLKEISKTISFDTDKATLELSQSEMPSQISTACVLLSRSGITKKSKAAIDNILEFCSQLKIFDENIAHFISQVCPQSKKLQKESKFLFNIPSNSASIHVLATAYAAFISTDNQGDVLRYMDKIFYTAKSPAHMSAAIAALDIIPTKKTMMSSMFSMWLKGIVNVDTPYCLVLLRSVVDEIEKCSSSNVALEFIVNSASYLRFCVVLPIIARHIHSRSRGKEISSITRSIIDRIRPKITNSVYAKALELVKDQATVREAIEIALYS